MVEAAASVRPRAVVDDLGGDVPVGAEHGEARPLGRARTPSCAPGGDVGSGLPLVAALTVMIPLLARLPGLLLATYSPA